MRYLGYALAVVLLLAVVAAGGVLYIFYEYGRGLPDHRQLADYQPPTVTRVHAGDGRLFAEYATEKRVFVPIEAIPIRVVNAFLSAEDKSFYEHPGVNPLAVARAVVTNVVNLIEGRRPVGASTITQQVAKNFLLTNELSLERKIKEAILALRIEQALDKDRILELYLNEIYLGFRSYGVAAAALNYFNKSLDELTIAEAAYLAALPKAPNNYHPHRQRAAAVARRDWVIGRMLEDGRIDRAQAEAAWAEPFEVRAPEETDSVEAAYFAEEVRRELVELVGESELYGGGLSVRTTLDPELQKIADRALRDGLIAYDRRHGWRGPVTTLDLGSAPAEAAWQERLADVDRPAGMHDWLLAVVLDLSDDAAEIGLRDGRRGRIPMVELRWAAPALEDQRVGAQPKVPGDVLAPGDVVMVEPVGQDEKGKDYPEGSYGLRQIPEVNGALVAIDPHTGRVLAMTGGYSFEMSSFNRATQAYRQPGSAFKPIVYLAGLDSGFTPSTIILDGPIVVDQGAGLGKWKPANYSDKFYGPTPLRVGLEKSRNLMTIRLAQAVGMEKIAGYAERLRVVDELEPVLSMALGAGETTLLRLTTAYAILVNGGRDLTPTLIDRIQDRKGRTIYRHDTRSCPDCRVAAWAGQDVPELPDTREQLVDPASAYQIVSMLEGVVKRGTGRRIAELGRPLAGKTGTTNEERDTWFIGFSPDLAVGVFIGFDEPRPLGRRETGSSVSAPVFKDFMAAALDGEPAIPFRVPPGIELVRVSAETGRPARAGDGNVFLEAFKPGTVPTGSAVQLGGGAGEAVMPGPDSSGRPPPGSGGLY